MKPYLLLSQHYYCCLTVDFAILWICFGISVAFGLVCSHFIYSLSLSLFFYIQFNLCLHLWSFNNFIYIYILLFIYCTLHTHNDLLVNVNVCWFIYVSFHFKVIYWFIIWRENQFVIKKILIIFLGWLIIALIESSEVFTLRSFYFKKF